MPKYKDNKIKKEYYLNRITKASGVPKVTVRKVINALPEVVWGILADCGTVQIFTGVQLEGVLKEDDKRTFFNPYTGEIDQSTTFIRPRCIFDHEVKKKIQEAYDKKQAELAEKERLRKLKEEEEDDWDD